MQKTMITATTVFALVVSAGASMAGPLGDHGFNGKAHDASSAVSQAHNSADLGDHTHQTDPGFDSGQENSSSTEPLGTDVYTFDVINKSGGGGGAHVILWSPK
ncbi:hypothetical protein [Ruegeria atlantica]|uniref:hypothetical protein n=1 Tax=Ruegeria atlantica TaxID=81569 RepID=UPI00147AEFD3|nr:hypothetical protein [Ruegeria atlantica]